MQSAVKRAGLRILTETVNSPTLAWQIQQVLAANPGAKWIQWEPVTRDHVRAGARMVLGQCLEPVYDFTKADVVVSLHADFLASEGGANLCYSRLASRRRLDSDPDRLNRLYAVEPTPTVTGSIKVREDAANRTALAAGQVKEPPTPHLQTQPFKGIYLLRRGRAGTAVDLWLGGQEHWNGSHPDRGCDAARGRAWPADAESRAATGSESGGHGQFGRQGRGPRY